MQGLKQELRMRQELTLQPQQILRSELIQLPIQELEMRVRAELEENPFLEELEGDTIDSDAVEPAEDDGVVSPALEDEEAAESQYPERTGEDAREVDWDAMLNDPEYWEYRARTRVSAEDTVDLPHPARTTLAEDLLEQLRMDDLSEEEIAIGEEIIGSINHDGYLEADLNEISARLGVPVELVESVHRRIMNLDPAGIGARDLRECLLVQLEMRDPPAPVALEMIRDHWSEFINKKFDLLAARLDRPLEDIKEAFQIISHLNPKPGEGYFDERQNYVIPDLIVTNIGGEFVVYLNDGDIPNFHINPAYRDMFLNRKAIEKNVRDFVTRKLEAARWFINAIHQRRTTMLRTMRAIVDRQRDFFEGGPSKLKPMILADIAGDIDMDISTISRVTNGKYVQTDWGIFELKYFFTEGMSTAEGDEVSNRVLKERIRELIAGEDKSVPYSDQDLTKILNKEGFQIRRRTVAKYREQLRIPIKRMRREI